MRYDKEDIQAALKVLREGGIIVYPTDTVWGLGCDATNAEAVKRLYALKEREDSKSMLVLLDSPAKLNYYGTDVRKPRGHYSKPRIIRKTRIIPSTPIKSP